MQLYVDTCAKQHGDGTSQAPFATIQAAADVAKPGDVVWVMPGVYRESVNPRYSGTKDKPILYRAVKQNSTVISGAERLDEWERVAGDVWRIAIANRRFGDYNPYTTLIEQGTGRQHAGEVFLNNRALVEADRFAAVKQSPATGAAHWYTEQDQAADTTVIYANFLGADPNHANVELTFRETCFYPQRRQVDFLVLSGFVLTKAASRWVGPDYNKAVVGTNQAQGWKILNCNITHGKCAGISLGRYPTTPAGTDFAQYPGRHLIKNSRIFDCGQVGIIGVDGNPAPVIEHNHLFRINTRLNLRGESAGAIDLSPVVGAKISRNCIHDCRRGVRLGGRVERAQISRNLMYANGLSAKQSAAEHHQDLLAGLGEDIRIENSVGVTTIDNNFLLSDYALRLESYQILLTHNLIYGRTAWLSAKAGQAENSPLFHRIGRGQQYGQQQSSYFYNNLFINKSLRPELTTALALAQRQTTDDCRNSGQKRGNNSFFATKDNRLVQLAANKAGNLVIDDNESAVQLKVEDRPTGFYLKHNLDEVVDEDSCRLLTFANDAGSGMVLKLDTDFSGQHREGNRVTPGPLDHKADYSACLFRALA